VVGLLRRGLTRPSGTPPKRAKDILVYSYSSDIPSRECKRAFIAQAKKGFNAWRIMALPAPHTSIAPSLGLELIFRKHVPLLTVFARRAYSQGSTIALMPHLGMFANRSLHSAPGNGFQESQRHVEAGAGADGRVDAREHGAGPHGVAAQADLAPDEIAEKGDGPSGRRLKSCPGT
jgi:hypothetical protein